MKIYALTIWRYNEQLHYGEYQFDSLGKAQKYHLGLYNGFALCGEEPTGMKLREVKIAGKKQ